MSPVKNYWLIKSEPHTYSIDQLRIDGTTSWSGVRNYQARNFIRDVMQVGDICLFYHSSAGTDSIGVVGLAEVVSTPYIDPTSIDPHSPYVELRSQVKWYAVDIAFKKKFKQIYTLKQIKNDPHLSHMKVAQAGNRLSIQPVAKADVEYIASHIK